MSCIANRQIVIARTTPTDNATPPEDYPKALEAHDTTYDTNRQIVIARTTPNDNAAPA
jgi:hypothetical protein